MSLMELNGFGYKMKEFLGVFMGELLMYRVKVKGKSKDIIAKDPNTKAKRVVGSKIILEYLKQQLVCQATCDRDYLSVMLTPKKSNMKVSDEFLDIVNDCLTKAREELIKREHKKDADFEDIVLTKLSAISMGMQDGGAKALICQNCGANLPPPSRSGIVVCPYCNATNIV
ncbi:MAG: hypothetical protein ACTSVI_04890 [Promethearchaeota archaeon]